ncbi:MAG: hydroxymethylbilane synthase [Actinobacteria bacterium]|nr:hydroxymethylbilane synthase [Actinomycetota bacterium]MBW3649014.1 hydroxymethylbilane synthase [Actinomycetota bacterium]
MRLRAATRGSALARWQTDHVAALLRQAHGPDLDIEVVVVQTEGDRRHDVPIEALGGRGVFVKEVQAAVLEGHADIAVHSAKDLPAAPSLQPPGLVLACVPERGDPRDALVTAAGPPAAATTSGRSIIESLPVAALVATGSVRRRAQLANLRPDLCFSGLRGNIETRLDRARGYDAVVIAAAALDRLGRFDAPATVVDPPLLLPQVGQGALAVECRADDAWVQVALRAVEHAASRAAVDAERAFLAHLGGGCDLPVGALASVDPAGQIHLEGLLASYDGRIVLRRSLAGPDPAALGAELATELLDRAGGRALLA